MRNAAIICLVAMLLSACGVPENAQQATVPPDLPAPLLTPTAPIAPSNPAGDQNGAPTTTPVVASPIVLPYPVYATPGGELAGQPECVAQAPPLAEGPQAWIARTSSPDAPRLLVYACARLVVNGQAVQGISAMVRVRQVLAYLNETLEGPMGTISGGQEGILGTGMVFNDLAPGSTVDVLFSIEQPNTTSSVTAQASYRVPANITPQPSVELGCLTNMPPAQDGAVAWVVPPSVEHGANIAFCVRLRRGAELGGGAVITGTVRYQAGGVMRETGFGSVFAGRAGFAGPINMGLGDADASVPVTIEVWVAAQPDGQLYRATTQGMTFGPQGPYPRPSQ